MEDFLKILVPENQTLDEQLAWLEAKIDDWLQKFTLVQRIKWDSVKNRVDTVGAMLLLSEFYYGVTFLPGFFNTIIKKADEGVISITAHNAIDRIKGKLNIDGAYLMTVVNEYMAELMGKVTSLVFTEEEREDLKERSLKREKHMV
jgi:hypothetical protein